MTASLHHSVTTLLALSCALCGHLPAAEPGAASAADGGKVPDAKAKRALQERAAMGFRPPADTVAAMGKGKNRCYVIPSLELVIIRMGDSEGREFTDNEFLAKLLNGTAK
jgi:hypothetical protein